MAGLRLATMRFTLAFLALVWVGFFLFPGVAVPLAWSATPKAQFVPSTKKQAPLGKDLMIDGIVAENDDLEEVHLYYRIQGAPKFRSIKMEIYKGVRFRAKIPAAQVSGAAVEYYVVGIDLSKKKLSLFASPQKPQRIALQKASDDDSDKDDDDSPREEKIFSAARKEQEIKKAPGVVTVITSEEIRAAGFRDLMDLLRYIVGFDVNFNGLSPDIGIRGVNPRLGFGDKIVLLIDGHNMAWRQLNRNSQVIGIDMIKQVEVIRGPGSTLWGANALSGVINIITKASGSLKGFTSTIGGSPLSRSYFVTLQGGKELIGGLTFRGSFSLFRDDRSPISAPISEFLKQGIHYTPSGDRETHQYFYGQLSYRGFNLTLYQNHYAGQLPMSNFSVVGGDDTYLTGERYIAKLSWLGLVGRGQLLLWGSYDYYGFGQESGYEANALVPGTSQSTLDGNSNHFGLYEIDPKNPAGGPQFKGYFPLCNAVSVNSPIPCIIIETKATGRVCKWVKSPRESEVVLGEYAIPNGPKPTTPKFCAPSYQGGRYVRPIRGYDNRFSAGIQFSLPIVDNFYATFGADFEYLNLLQVYSPDIWKLLGLDLPSYNNVHLSAFVQLQYSIGSFLELTAGARVDYDQIYGVVPTPRAAVVWTPGGGFFAKALYGNAFKAPSFLDLFYSRRNETYGNPTLRPESVHTFELQVGWSNNKILAISLNGFYSRFSDLIFYTIREKGEKLVGVETLSDAQKKKSFPVALQPDGTQVYEQKSNSSNLQTYGGEIEFRLFLVRGLNVRAGFGFFYGQDESTAGTASTNYVNPLDFAARMMGSLQVSYLHNFKPLAIQLSVGALFVGPKTIPKKALSIPGAILPQDDVNTGKSTHPPCKAPATPQQAWLCGMPTWTADKDPTSEAPAYLQTYASLQFLRIFGHLDVIFRVTNLLNADIYDANDELLSPQKKLDFMAWLRVRY